MTLNSKQAHIETGELSSIVCLMLREPQPLYYNYGF